MSIEINVTLNGAQNLSEYMKKADFDPDGNFIPESAEKLDDGTNEVTAAQAKDAVDKAHVAATAGAGPAGAGSEELCAAAAPRCTPTRRTGTGRGAASAPRGPWRAVRTAAAAGGAAAAR